MYAAANKPATILIIDDNITNLKVAMKYLKAYSFNILTARDGIAGIERALLTQPELVLLDVQLPGIDGFETCRRLKANPATAHIPVIFMTVLSEAADKVRGLEAGAVDYITKPIDETELLARVNTQLRLHALQAQLQQVNAQLAARIQEHAAALEAEAARRLSDQAEKDALLQVFRQQNEQFSQLAQLVRDTQDPEAGYIAADEQIISLLTTQLTRAHHLLITQASQPQLIDVAAQIITAALATTERLREQVAQGSAKLEAFNQRSVRHTQLQKLSEREYEVFQLLIQGKSNAEIVEALVLAKTTVSTYQRRIMEKLNVSDVAELVELFRP